MARRMRADVGAEGAVLAVGYSLGAMILNKFVGEEGGACPLTAAVACSASVDLVRSMARLHGSAFNLATFGAVMVGAEKAMLRKHARHFVPGAPGEGLIDLERGLAADTVRDFDSAVLVPMFKYKDFREYCVDASILHRLPAVAVPLLLINAADDPIADVLGIDADAVRANANVIACITSEGGHVAWIAAAPGLLHWPALGESWETTAAVQWMNAVQLDRKELQKC